MCVRVCACVGACFAWVEQRDRVVHVHVSRNKRTPCVHACVGVVCEREEFKRWRVTHVHGIVAMADRLVRVGLGESVRGNDEGKCVGGWVTDKEGSMEGA